MHPAGRRPAPPTWHRGLRQLLTLLLGAILAGIGLTYLHPLLKARQDLLAEESRVAAQLGEMRHLQAGEEAKLRWLRNDDEYLQIQARDKLDLQAPGETVVRIGPAP
jgi:cell division protein FtsB